MAITIKNSFGIKNYMKEIQCKICNNKILVETNGDYTCSNCGIGGNIDMGNRIQSSINKYIDEHIDHLKKYDHYNDSTDTKKEIDLLGSSINDAEEYVKSIEKKKNDDELQALNDMLNFMNKSKTYETLRELIELLNYFPLDSKYEITDKGIVIYTNTKLGIVNITGGK